MVWKPPPTCGLVIWLCLRTPETFLGGFLLARAKPTYNPPHPTTSLIAVLHCTAGGLLAPKMATEFKRQDPAVLLQALAKIAEGKARRANRFEPSHVSRIGGGVTGGVTGGGFPISIN